MRKILSSLLLIVQINQNKTGGGIVQEAREERHDWSPGCPTSYRIVNGSKLLFSRLIGKFKKNESF